MRVDVADEALGLVDGSGGIDRQWLADHHITSSMINELGDDRLLAMGLDPQELRAAAAALDASDATVACPVDASTPPQVGGSAVAAVGCETPACGRTHG